MRLALGITKMPNLQLPLQIKDSCLKDKSNLTKKLFKQLAMASNLEDIKGCMLLSSKASTYNYIQLWCPWQNGPKLSINQQKKQCRDRLRKKSLDHLKQSEL